MSLKKPSSTAPLSWIRTPHPNYFINSAAISGDGKTVIAGTFFHEYSSSRTPTDTQNGTFGTYVYDASGNLRWADTYLGWQGVFWVAISRDGSTAASGGWYCKDCPSGGSYLGMLRAYDGQSGTRQLTATPPGRVNMVALSGDGEILTAAGESAWIYGKQGTNQFTLLGTLPAPSGYSFTVATVSDDGCWAVFGAYNQSTYESQVILVDLTSGTLGQTYSWTKTQESLHAIAINDDGSTFVVGGSDSNVYIFDRTAFMSSGNPSFTYSMGQGTIWRLGLSSDGSQFSAITNTSSGGIVAMVDLGTQGPTLRWKQTTAQNPNSTSMDANGSYVTVSDGYETEGNFYLYNGSGVLQWSYHTTDMNWPCEVSADGSKVVGGSDDGSVYYFLN